MSSQKLNLRWNDYEANLSGGLRDSRHNKDFFDVTLAYDDGQISAHKVIISSCSSFFLNILRKNPHQHPLVYMRGVRYTELNAVLDFMYHGEVSIYEEELNSFLALAEDLQVKGLTQDRGGVQRRSSNPRRDEAMRHVSPSSASPAPVCHSQYQEGGESQQAAQSEEARTVDEQVDNNGGSRSPGNKEDLGVHEDGDEARQPKTGTGETGEAEQLGTGGGEMGRYEEEHGDNSQQYDDDIIILEPVTGVKLEVPNGRNATENEESRQEEINCYEDFGKFMTQNDKGSYSCSLCNNNVRPQKQKGNILIHIESQHFPNVFAYNCPQCSTVFGSRSALYTHTNKYHKK